MTSRSPLLKKHIQPEKSCIEERGTNDILPLPSSRISAPIGQCTEKVHDTGRGNFTRKPTRSKGEPRRTTEVLQRLSLRPKKKQMHLRRKRSDHNDEGQDVHCRQWRFSAPMMGIVSLTLDDDDHETDKELLGHTNRKRCHTCYNRSDSLHPGARHLL